jgi:hypothetical protein
VYDIDMQKVNPLEHGHSYQPRFPIKGDSDNINKLGIVYISIQNHATNSVSILHQKSGA